MLIRVFWLTVSSFAMRAVSMLFQVYLTDHVGAAGLGLLQLIMTVHAFAITLGTSGIRVAAMYLCAEEYGHRRLSGVRAAMMRCMIAGLLLSISVGIILMLGAEQLAYRWIKDLRAAAGLRLLGLTLPITCLSAILCGYFTACGKIRRLVLVEIADRAASVLLTVRLLRAGHPQDVSHACVAIIGGGAIASLGSSVVLLAMMWSDLRRCPRPQAPHHMTGRLVRFCIPVALNDYLRSGLGTLEQFLIPYGLARCGGSRTDALSDYGTIHGMVFPVLMFMSTVLFSVADLLIPNLARCRAVGNTEKLRQIVERCLRASCLFSVAVGGSIFLSADSLGLLLYNSQTAGRYLRLFAPLLPILYLDCIVDGMHKGLGEQIYCVRVNTLTNFLDVIGLYLLLPQFGIGGYFFTYTATHVLNFYLSFHRLMKHTEITPSPSFLLLAVLGASLPAFAIHTIAPPKPTWSSTFVCVALYVLMLSLFWVLTLQNRKNSISKNERTA